ncbi:MAG TPA: hypothetical protein VF188_06100 [Longimicrobiales bacterium]
MIRCAGAALLALLLAGCGTTDPVAESDGEVGLTPEAFIQVMVDLSRAAETAATPEAYATEKRAILERHGTTEDALIGFAERYGADAEAMAAVWDSIEKALAADTAASSAPAAPPAPPAPALHDSAPAPHDSAPAPHDSASTADGDLRDVQGRTRIRSHP